MRRPVVARHGRVTSSCSALSTNCVRRRGSPLKPKTVIDTFAALAKDNGVRELVSDARYRESAREHLEPHKVTFIDAPSGRDGKNEVYLLA